MDLIFNPSLALYLPLYELDGASFMSKDKHGHLCTVTGALWTPQGRFFDGDDKITIPDHSALDFGSSVFTLIYWMKTSTKAKCALSKGIYTAGNGWQTYTGDGGEETFCTEGNYTTFVCSASTADGVWHQVAFVRDASDNGVAYIDGGSPKTATAFFSGITIADSNDFLVGDRTGVSLGWNGSIGEVTIYNRHAFTALEIQHNYLATKWRYR